MSGFRMKGSDKRTTMLSSHGIVRGGPHDGSRYCFLGFSCGKRSTLRIHLRLTPANWPFPRDVALGKADFSSLVGVAGERAPRIDTAPLMLQAIRDRALVAAPPPERLHQQQDDVESTPARKAEKDVKLTPAQQELLQRMRQGAQLKLTPTSLWPVLLPADGLPTNVPHQVFSPLLRAKLLRPLERLDADGCEVFELAHPEPRLTMIHNDAT